MDFDFSDDQEQLRDAVRKWVDKGYTFDRRREITHAGGFDRAAYTELPSWACVACMSVKTKAAWAWGPLKAWW